MIEKFKDFFRKRKDTRQESLDWWSSLSREKQLEYESDFFDKDEMGDTEDIDIEAMYKTYAIDGKKVKKDFNIDEFNNWFKTEFTGYDGRKGAPGIFLRLDKFSHNMLEDYLKEIGIEDPSYEEVEKYYQMVRKDWMNKQYNR